MTTATLKTFDHQLPIGLMMTVWRVTYTWQPHEHGCPQSHYLGGTPSVSAHAEIDTATLVHVGGAHVSCHAHYRENETVYRNSRDGEFAWGADFWDAMQDRYAERVMASERLQREIAKHEEKNFCLE